MYVCVRLFVGWLEKEVVKARQYVVNFCVGHLLFEEEDEAAAAINKRRVLRNLDGSGL